jgi:ankyrin repeat protein
MNTIRTQQLRQRLCAATALNQEVERNNLSESLDSIFNEVQVSGDSDSSADINCVDQGQQNWHEDDASNITPLMMACDKSHSAALTYLRKQLERSRNGNQDKLEMKYTSLSDLVSLWGHPTESSSVSEGANSAAHHAMAAGFVFGLEVIEDFLVQCEEDLASGNHTQHNRISRLQVFHSLISQSNANGDTPIMMACVFGHTEMIKHVLGRHLQLSAEEIKATSTSKHVTIHDLKIENILQPLQQIFAIRNEEGCSALNLSCGHGNVDTVQLIARPLYVKFHQAGNSLQVDILQGNGPDVKVSMLGDAQNFALKSLAEVSYDDVKFCKSSLENIEAELKFMQPQSGVDVNTDGFVEQSNKIHNCEDVLNAELNRISADAMSELMSGEMNTTSDTAPRQAAGKKSKKKKQRKSKQHGTQVPDENLPSPLTCGIATDHGNQWSAAASTANQRGDGLLVNSSPFITLQDGRVVSKTQQSDSLETVCSDDAPTEVNENDLTPRSLQTVLQSQSEFDIEAKMESLCLDPSQLFLTSHGMAMELSPCQLEAMQSILEHQLNATKEAQDIQKRLLRKDLRLMN